MVTFAYLTGWRTRSEVQKLTWRQVDFKAGTIRLEVGTTKNGDGRQFPMTADLRALLEAQRAHADDVQRQQGSIIPWVFHRDGNACGSSTRRGGTPVGQPGCPGAFIHDFHRTSVWSIVRAGIPERVAMTMTGHRTRQIFERYNIISEGDLADARRRLDERRPRADLLPLAETN